VGDLSIENLPGEASGVSITARFDFNDSPNFKQVINDDLLANGR
jgi:hypothetical protein